METTMSRTIQKSVTDIETMGYIQCVTCGKVLGHLYQKAEELRMRNFTEGQIYETLGLKRTCCRYHLTLGIKLPMVKYLDETVRLDMDEELLITSEQKESSDKILSIKSRLTKLKEAKPETISKNQSETSSYGKISFFVAT
jgi:DNA-directed RNA polymerase subunit N (RpoN/RPB10)